MYQHILLAVEFGKDDDLIGQKVKKLIDLFQAQLNLIHIVELPIVDIFPGMPDKEKRYAELAKEQLAEYGKKLNVSLDNQYVEVGNPKILIPEFIKQHNIDLLIIGHHSRKGVYHLLGSTAYAILSHAKCDVLTVPYMAY